MARKFSNNAFYRAAGLTEDVVAQIEGIDQQYSTAVSRIKADSRLTDAAKRTDLAKAYVKARDAMAGVQQSFEQEEARYAQTLSRRVFGNSPTTGADVIAQRDADDRALRYESPQEAQTALARAESNGDTSLARAIALRAHSELQTPFGSLSGWKDVLTSFAGSRPGAAEDIAELTDITVATPQGNLNRSMAFSVSPPAGVAAHHADPLAAAE
jgi:hypothetical protein